MTSKSVFITGNSSGLGKGLTESFLTEDYSVYGCSRRGSQLTGNIKDILIITLLGEALI